MEQADLLKLGSAAFAGTRCIARGELHQVVSEAWKALQKDPALNLLVFTDFDGDTQELDLHGTHEEALERLQTWAPRRMPRVEDEESVPVASGPGRPKLGVVGREVTLLPRHWEWLDEQRGGASVTLRRLVEQARKAAAPADRIRYAQEAANRFMTVVAGNLPGYEEATRALYAKDGNRFNECIAHWPQDVQDYSRSLARAAFESDGLPV